MLPSTLRRHPRGFRRVNPRDGSMSPSPGPSEIPYSSRRHATADFTEADDDEDEDEDFGEGETRASEDEGDGQEQNEAEAAAQQSPQRRQRLPVLPLFSTTHLDTLPVYSITHAIRIIVCARTETTLTWEQLRSPQVSQFLVKPMQQQIRTQHFSRSTLFALMANCLQFSKEGQRYAANAGTSNTRARVCELLALKLLKEYSTRELIDALAYDFYPLQGLPGASSPLAVTKSNSKAKNQMSISRTSTLEVAIRASAKHFLAHPVVVQQLEAIWNGAITFYSSADSLHRDGPSGAFQQMNGQSKPDDRTPLLGSLPPKEGPFYVPPGRRTVMLYDPRQASMLKLSRLRVPRYRSFLSTVSLAVLIGLFLAVLSERSVQITGLELVFWFWSAGFMLDELVGFNEQGFSLYIMSFWNIFDLGILVLLIAYYCMRAYGVFLADPHHWNDMAYDVLAANAILLLPRIFSVLDHYQYFSQLLIAFRLMAVDLVAVLILVLIACSGFYVFFTLSKNQNDGGEVAYKIFQILMGFTPAAWDVWPSYNWLARILMGLFLIICHFLVVTILITVLTNSFMTIASNATEEHQFLFAINTISMVKNDALFSYIAPSNIFAWLLMPLRYCIPLKHFVWLNRTIIKITHFPVLFCIYLYERFWLAPSMYEPTDLVENPGRGRGRHISFADPASRTMVFSPNVRVREESVAGFQKDRALEEVFRLAPDSATLRTQRRNERRKTQNAIRNWMDAHDEEGGSPGRHWPSVDSRVMPEFQRRFSSGWARPSNLRLVSDARSIASDPADLLSNNGAPLKPTEAHVMTPTGDGYKDQTDADGDDELVTNDEDEDDVLTNTGMKAVEDKEDYFSTPTAARFGTLASSHGSAKQGPPRPGQRKAHTRSLSTNTILYNPEQDSSQSPPKPKSKTPSKTGTETPPRAGRKTPPRRNLQVPAAKPRPIMSPRGITETGGISRSALMSIEPRNRPRGARRLSSVDISIMSDNTNLPFVGEDPNAGLAGSFQTQMAMALMKEHKMRAGASGDNADRDRMGRLVLARMKTLEEGFAEVIKEMRDLKNSSTAPPTRGNSSGEDLRGPLLEAMNRERKRARAGGGDQSPKKSSSGGGKRPVSRRSLMETRGQKGKGREDDYTTDDEADVGESFERKGSSY